MVQTRDLIQNEVTHLADVNALIILLSEKEINHEKVQDGEYYYIKIINDDGKSINLKGRGFEHVSHLKSEGEQEKTDTEVSMNFRRYWDNTICKEECILTTEKAKNSKKT